MLILGTGVLHGLQTDRWGESAKVLAAAERLNSIPTSFGNWTSEATEIPEDQLKIAEALGHFARQFRNSETGEVVNIMILCGRPGPISVHPPTVCFVGAGWQLEAEPKTISLSAALQEKSAESLWNTRFVRSVDGVPVRINTSWGWNSAGEWQAYENARLKTAGAPYLYKMYATIPVSVETESVESDVLERFWRDFLPLVDEALFDFN